LLRKEKYILLRHLAVYSVWCLLFCGKKGILYENNKRAIVLKENRQYRLLRINMFQAPERFRVIHKDNTKGGNNGFFALNYRNAILFVLSTDTQGYEHISVTAKDETRNKYGSTNRSEYRSPSDEELNYCIAKFWKCNLDVMTGVPPRQRVIDRTRPSAQHAWRKI
jgi:hypothetical protein